MSKDKIKKDLNRRSELRRLQTAYNRLCTSIKHSKISYENTQLNIENRKLKKKCARSDIYVILISFICIGLIWAILIMSSS